MDIYENGDIVEITYEPYNKWGIVTDASGAIGVNKGLGSIKVRILEPSGGEIYFSTLLLKKWEIRDIIATKCPLCIVPWSSEENYQNEKDLFCKECGKTKIESSEILKDKLK
jgi:hypothetical protein